MRQSAKVGLIVLFLMGVAGCKTTGGLTVYVSPTADFTVIKKVAILPFENMTQDRFAGEKVQKLVTIDLLSLGVFDILETGQVARVLREQGIENPTGMAPAQIKKLGEALGAQAFVFGAVVDYGESRSGTIPSPDVTIQLRLVEARSGGTLWSVSGTRSGAKLSTQLFGVGGETPTQAAERLIRTEVDTILAK